MNTLAESSRFQVPALDCAGHLIPKPRRKSKALKFGSITVPYQEFRNGRGSRYFMLFFYENGLRRRECRSNFKALKKRAEEIATNIANGQAAMTHFGEESRAS